MTGRELILYILENGLENESVFNDGKFVGFMTEEEAAVKFGVGVNTIHVYVNQGLLEGMLINQILFIPVNAQNPKDIIEERRVKTIC